MLHISRIKVLGIILILLTSVFLANARATLTESVILSSHGSIVHENITYSNIVYCKESTYYVKDANSIVLKESTDFSDILTFTLSRGGLTLITNGTYHLKSHIMESSANNAGIVGETESGCIIDLSGLYPSISYGSTNWIPSGQYAGIVIKGGNLTIKNLTFQNYDTAVLGLGEYDSNTPSKGNLVENIHFKNCKGGGIYIYDGSDSTVENISGDNPYGLVYFWYGSQSNIQVKNLYMEPTVATANGYGVDSTLAFLPSNGEYASNISINNIIGNYTKYFAQGGNDFHIGGVVDFHSCDGGINEQNSRGNVTWTNLAVCNVYGYYAPALDIQMNFTGLTDSIFENIHSSNAQDGSGMKAGIIIFAQLSNSDITINNIIFRNIFVENAFGAGFLFLFDTIGAPHPSVHAVIQNITFENLFLLNNNQQRGTKDSSLGVLYNGISGLNIGNMGPSNTFNNLTINNLQVIDDQTTPTQQYPITWWNYGASTFTNIQVNGGVFMGNAHEQPYIIPFPGSNDKLDVQYTEIEYEK